MRHFNTINIQHNEIQKETIKKKSISPIFPSQKTTKTAPKKQFWCHFDTKKEEDFYKLPQRGKLSITLNHSVWYFMQIPPCTSETRALKKELIEHTRIMTISIALKSYTK